MKVTYNGITLQIVHTTEASRVAVLSDDGTELLYSRHTYQFEAIYNRAATAYLSNGAPTPGAEAAITDNAIRYMLMQPRQQLTILADDKDQSVVLESPQPGFDVDANNGPIPMSCVVNLITPGSWRVAFRIKTDIIECGEVGSQDTPIISNRYSQTQMTGLDHRTTITTRGVTVFRTDQLANVARIADSYRNECIPGLPFNYQRQSIHVAVSSGANILTWQVIDQQVFRSIGSSDNPLTRGVVRFTAVFATKSAPLDKDNMPSNYILAQFDATAWGNTNSSRAGMFDWLGALAVERCSIPNGPANPALNPVIMGVATEESIDEPRCSLHVTLRIPPAKRVAQGFGELRTDFIGIDNFNSFANDGMSPQFPGDNNTRGTTSTELLVSALKVACTTPSAPPTSASESSGYPGDNYQNSSTLVEVTSTSIETNNESNYSDDATQNGTYTEMRVESSYKTDRGILGCPIAGMSSSSSSGSTSPGTVTPNGLTFGGGDPDNDVEILTMSRPMTKVSFKWEAERTSAPPAIPNPQVTDPNLVLATDDIYPMAIGVAPDGFTPVYRIGGEYTYIAKQARAVVGSFALGVHPWTSFSYDDDVANIPASTFVHGIIDSADSSGGAFETVEEANGDDGGDGGGVSSDAAPGQAF